MQLKVHSVLIHNVDGFGRFLIRGEVLSKGNNIWELNQPLMWGIQSIINSRWKGGFPYICGGEI
jgi:hypothetical protein